MRILKKITSVFAIMATFVFALLLMSPQASAMYDKGLNTLVGGDQLVIDPVNNKLSITIKYQYQVTDVNVYICENDEPTTADCISNAKSVYKDYENFSNPREYRMSEINSTSQETMNYIFSPNLVYAGMNLRDYTNGQYKLYVTSTFCNLRNGDLTACESWTYDNNIYYNTITINTSFTPNNQLNKTINDILVIVNNYVIPVLWILLGVLLIVRGIILAIDIVKASDEAEVRHKKIQGLTWLIIGVLAGYAITIAASWVMSLLGIGGILK